MADPATAPISPHIRIPYLTLEADDPARIAYRRMEGDNERSLVVVRNQQYVGVVVWQTIRRLSRTELGEPLRKFTQPNIPTLTRNMSIASAMEAFDTTEVAAVGLLPVVGAGGSLEGVIERDEFQGLMEDASGTITVREDPVAHLVTGPNVPEPGAKVVGSDGRKLGKFEHHVDDRGRPRWMSVRHGFLWKKRSRYVPLVAVERQSPKEVVLNIDYPTWATFRDRPVRK